MLIIPWLLSSVYHSIGILVLFFFFRLFVKVCYFLYRQRILKINLFLFGNRLSLFENLYFLVTIWMVKSFILIIYFHLFSSTFFFFVDDSLCWLRLLQLIKSIIIRWCRQSCYYYTDLFHDSLSTKRQKKKNKQQQQQPKLN